MFANRWAIKEWRVDAWWEFGAYERLAYRMLDEIDERRITRPL